HTLSDFDTPCVGNGCEASGTASRWEGQRGKSAALLGSNEAPLPARRYRRSLSVLRACRGSLVGKHCSALPALRFTLTAWGQLQGLGGSFQRAGLPSGEPRRGISLGGRRPAVKAPLRRCKQRP